MKLRRRNAVGLRGMKTYSSTVANAEVLRSALGTVIAVTFLMLCVRSAQAQLVVTDQDKHGIVKLLDQSGLAETIIPESVITGNGIDYHGGPVMHGPHNIYLLWYGNWSNNTAMQILPAFISGLIGSSYFNTTSTYGDNSGNIANTVTLAGQFFDSGSLGTNLGTNGVRIALSNALQNQNLPVDGNGIYLVLTSPEITEGSFCTQYCGYHTHGTFNTTDIKFGFIGDPATQCPARPNVPVCSVQALTPNGNEGADAMASVMAHEINETVTDPDINAWYLNAPD